MKAHEDLPVLVVHSKVITKAHEEFSILVVETKGARAFRKVSQSQQQFLSKSPGGRAGGRAGLFNTEEQQSRSEL